jgi:hypothetical protein
VGWGGSEYWQRVLNSTNTESQLRRMECLQMLGTILKFERSKIPRVQYKWRSGALPLLSKVGNAQHIGLI